MSSPAYDALIRELARDRRPLTCADMALVIREFPEIPGESIADEYEAVAKMLELPVGRIPYLGELFATRMLTKCEAYIESDVAEMRRQIELEDADDDVFTRRAV
jgi:hypothetical protein